MRVLVLGAGGSFGVNCCQYFLDQNDVEFVYGVGRAPLRPSAFSLGIENNDRYEYKALHIGFEYDLLFNYLNEIRPNVIINYAAQGEGAVSWKNSWRYFDTNGTALVRLVEFLQDCDWLDRFIQIGTSEMYGSVIEPASEESAIQPSSPYAASKVAFDLYLKSISNSLGFRMNIIRPCNAYCPGQLLHRVIPRTLLFGLMGKKLELHGGGKAEKSYIHATDLSRAIYLVTHNGVLGEIYNVGAESPTSIKDVVATCSEVLGIPFDDLCEVAPERLGQDSRYWLDSSRINRDVGWVPEISLRDGIQDVKNWIELNLEFLSRQNPDYEFRG